MVIEEEESIEKKVSAFNFPAIIKSQIAIGSRKKAGLIEIAKSQKEAVKLCKTFFNRIVADHKVEAVLIEELVEIEKEFYVSIALDVSERKFYLIASGKGGIDIETVSKESPEEIYKMRFSYSEGLTDAIAQKMAKRLDFKEKIKENAIKIFKKLWRVTKELEAQLVEINPLVLTSTGLIAVDAKMILDDNSAFRQSIVRGLKKKKETELEKIAYEAGFSFVKLNGDIGILANGAGLTMALLDVLSNSKLEPANFLDVGGGSSKERVYKALKLLFKLKPKCMLINIFGGITRCDIVAKAIIQALEEFKNAPPIIIRLIGTNDKEGIEILKKKGINTYQDIMEAVKKLKEVLSK